MITKEYVTQALDSLDETELHQVAEYVAFLKFRARANAASHLGTAQLQALQSESTAEHQAMGEGTEAAKVPQEKISDADFRKVVASCRSLPPPQGDYRVHDYVENLLLTVLDYQMRGTTVERAIEYYTRHARGDVSNFNELNNLLARYPDTSEGNLHVARYLWGYEFRNRVQLLRRLVAYFEANGVTTQDKLEQWSRRADYERDFRGKVQGAGLAIFQWLLIRQGIETVKPDIWVHRFIEDSVGYRVSDETAVEVLEQVARELGVPANSLDWRIWQHQRRLPKGKTLEEGLQTAQPPPRSGPVPEPHEHMDEEDTMSTSDEVVAFDHDERGYLDWISNNHDGYVLTGPRPWTTRRRPRPSFVNLHRASCWTIGEAGPGHYTDRQYMKVCSRSLDGLIQWSEKNGGPRGGYTKACKICDPAKSQ